jgi:hypothetical protein
MAATVLVVVVVVIVGWLFPEFRYLVTFVVAWTLADLAGRTSPGVEQVGTALSFRQEGGAR